MKPCEYASAGRGSLDARPRTFAHGRASCAPSYGLSAPPSPRQRGPEIKSAPFLLRHLPPLRRGREKRARCVAFDLAFDLVFDVAPLQRTEHRRWRRMKPEGWRDGSRQFVGGLGRTSNEPRRCREAQGTSRGSLREVRCRGRRLFGYFFFAVEEKVTRSPQASGSSCSHEKRRTRNWIPAFAGMTSKRSRSQAPRPGQ